MLTALARGLEAERKAQNPYNQEQCEGLANKLHKLFINPVVEARLKREAE